jgi:2-polyprenyl-3-methyl-5-hydroxy-6-metoxy-1,4-benzoquinol methylase
VYREVIPSIAENLRLWNRKYDWSAGGAEWSSLWGGVEAQWYWVLYPRIHRFVPASSILEIAPGFGRWTQYLKNLCGSLTVVDVSGRCIDACKERFTDASHIRYHINDGMSLSMVEDESIDFVFSFDSLVHVEQDVIDAYVKQLATKLTANGAVFMHHSNLAAVEGKVQHAHWRARSVSAQTVRASAEEAGLHCFAQEIVNFGDSHVGRGDELIDCFTILRRPGVQLERPTNVVENSTFMPQSDMIARLARLYGGEPDGSTPLVQPSRLRRLLSRPSRPGEP